MDTKETLEKELERHQAELEKHKIGIKKSIPIILGLIVILPIIPLPLRRRKGIHAMTESMSYPLCVAILGLIIGVVVLRYTYKERKRLSKEIKLLNQKIEKFDVSQ